jgi:hypothetical protein
MLGSTTFAMRAATPFSTIRRVSADKVTDNPANQHFSQ